MGAGGGGGGGLLFKTSFNQMVRYTFIRGSNSAIFIFHSLPNDIQFLMKRIRSLGEIRLRVYLLGRALSSWKANRKSYNLFPFVKMAETWRYTHAR